MCGIAGVVFADPKRPCEASLLRRMADQIAHRGPDAEGIWRAAGVGLAHRRLSIIDLSEGRQPLANEDGTVHVVFNGEIYNYRELRDQLLAKGHEFRTHSDTEVLVHLYEEERADLVHRLRGMFAFAIWDARRRTLLLARDRVGQKPLYVYRSSDRIVFGSEIKSILAAGQIDLTLDYAALEDYLSFGMIPGERSIFQKIRKLPPGHVLSVDANRWNAEPNRYWRFQPRIETGRSVSQWLEAIESKVAETVSAHLVADVPVGAFLSGGVDSSVIVGRMSDAGNGPVKTFSIGFHEQKFSELPHARQVAEHYGCDHFEQVVTPEAITSLDDLVRFYDEPFADSSAIPSMYVARLARQHVKVVLSGDGGDEAFGGYARYIHDLREARVRRAIPNWVRKTILRGLGRCWPKADWLPRLLRAKTCLTNLSLEPDEAYANTLTMSRLPLRRQLLAADVRRSLSGHRPETRLLQAYATAPQQDMLAPMLATDIAIWLPDDFLTKVDRASMACGLEVRPPLVDHELLELCATLPSEFKIRGAESKWIFKQIYAPQLPPAVTQRAKQGFEIPVDAWLRGPLREVFEDTVLAPNAPVSALIDQPTVRRLYRSHASRVGRHGSVLWALLVLARWTNEYLGPAPSAFGRS